MCILTPRVVVVIATRMVAKVVGTLRVPLLFTCVKQRHTECAYYLKTSHFSASSFFTSSSSAAMWPLRLVTLPSLPAMSTCGGAMIP